MPVITINLTNDELSPDDIDLIKSSLGLPANQNMAQVLPQLFKPALIEYIKMFKDGGLPGRAAEVMQERLFFLIKHYFEGIPSEEVVENIFQITSAQSKTLLRNTESRYRTRISHIKRAKLLEVLLSAVADGDDHRFQCTSPLLIEDLNKIISRRGPDNALIKQEAGTASMYRIPADTYNLLHGQLA